MGAQTFPNLSAVDEARLLLHLRKHKIYPYRYSFLKTTNAATFDTADGALGSYLTFTLRPNNYTGVVSIATNMILSPNTTIGRYAITFSYNQVLTLADQAALTNFDTEAQEIYQLVTNGGAINDFQVFYPLNWFIEKGRPLFIHLWVDAATITAGTATIAGSIIVGTLIATQQ